MYTVYGWPLLVKLLTLCCFSFYSFCPGTPIDQLTLRYFINYTLLEVTWGAECMNTNVAHFFYSGVTLPAPQCHVRVA